jgi:hypothetical protein
MVWDVLGCFGMFWDKALVLVQMRNVAFIS